jgi:hypothetical protein
MSAKIVLIISLVLVFFGLLTLVFGVLQRGDVQEKVNLSNFKVEGFNTAIFGTAVLVLGAFAACVGCCGVGAAKKKTKIFTCPFSICSFVVGALLLAFAGLILGFASGLVDKAYDGACKKINEAGDNALPKEYDYYISRTMCSPPCPCDDQYKSMWTDNTLPGKRFEDAGV